MLYVLGDRFSPTCLNITKRQTRCAASMNRFALVMASSQRLTVNTQSLFSTVSPPAVHWGYTTTFNVITVLETSKTP